MTQTPIKWTRVIFGAGLTLAVAMSPILYLALFAPQPDGMTRQASRGAPAFGLVSNGFDPLDHRNAFLLIAGIAVASVLTAVTVAARALNTASTHTNP